MQASLSTDYVRSTTSMPNRFKHIAEAGFTCVHWGAHGGDDFVYHDGEMEQMRRWLDESGVICADVHGTAGVEKRWMSPVEYVRQAGMELVRNRIRLAATIGAKVVVMHMSPATGKTVDTQTRDQVRRNIEELMGQLEAADVSLALENLFYIEENTELLHVVFDEIDSPRLGLCYDSGHGQITGAGLDVLERHADRLLALHLHDNDGRLDAHLLPGAGAVDWERTLQLIAASPYGGPLTLEVLMGGQCDADERRFLDEAHQTAERMIRQIEQLRAGA